MHRKNIIIALLLQLAVLFGVAGCASAPTGGSLSGTAPADLPDDQAYTITETDVRGHHNAIFERNGEICYFNCTDGSIIILASGGKYSPVLSSNHTKILYRNSVLETEGNIMQFGIIDLTGSQILEVKVDTEFSNDILECEWISECLVGITTHVNPATSEYFIYDASTGEFKSRLIGYSFSQIPNSENIIYAKNVPYWSDESIYHSYVIDEKIVYTSDILNARLGQPVFSEDSSKIVFVENLPEGYVITDNETAIENQVESPEQVIIIADFSVVTQTLINPCIIAIPPEIIEDLYIDENNDVCIIINNVLQKYNDSTKSFDVSIIDTNTYENTIVTRNFADLLESVTRQWGDDSLDKINCVSWTDKQVR